MIKLYQFEPAFGLPNASPFCMKLETYLRMAGLAFEIVPRASLFKAPKDKMPYIEDDRAAPLNPLTCCFDPDWWADRPRR